MPHFVMDFTQGVGGRFAVRLRRERPAKNGLAHALFTPGNKNARYVLRGVGGRLEKNLHTLRDDAGSVPA